MEINTVNNSIELNDQALVNSREYWDNRFNNDWESCGGRDQTRFFCRLAVTNLPDWLVTLIRQQKLTICDWGCAEGDGTDVLSQFFSKMPVVGVDFSTSAIEKARNHYPGLQFLAEDFLTEISEEKFDILFTSNTLEHFSQPWEIFNKISQYSTKFLILLIPYREFERIIEHEVSFEAANILLSPLHPWILTYSRVINTRELKPTYWFGEQILLIYTKLEMVEKLNLTLSNISLNEDCWLDKINQINSEKSVIYNKIDHINQQVEHARNEVTDLKQSLEAAQGEVVALRKERDTTQNQAIELETRIEQVRNEAEQARNETKQARNEVEQARNEAERARNEVEQARNQAERARNEVEQARNQAERARNEVERARNEAERTHKQQLELAQRELDQIQNNHQLALKVKQEQIEQVNEQLNKVQDQLTQSSQNMAIKQHQEAFLFSELALLKNWLEQIEQNFTATLHSWRWRVGHSTISLVEKLLMRRRVLLGVDHIQSLLKQFQSHSVNIERQEDKILQTSVPLVTSTINASHAAKILASPQLIPSSYDLICFANIDWNARYQRPQQIATQFARHGHRVFYIIASRCLSPDDIQGFRASAVADNIFEVELMASAVVDRYSTVLDTANAEIFLQSIDRLRAKFGIVDAVCNIHLAFWTPLALQLRNHWGWNVLYDCMDEWEDFPNIGKPLLEAEKHLVKESDIVTVTAALLEQKWNSHNPHCVLVRNGVDFNFYRQHYQPSQILNHITHPIIGFFGALAEWVDLGLLAAVARARPNWQLVLLGDVFVTDLEGLDSLTNVHLLGRRPYEEMPLYLYHFDVCLIPFRINQVTHAVDPVKFYEYVSAGKPVVSVPLKELEIYKDYLYFADTQEGFVLQIECAMAENNPRLQQARIDLARENDWQHRYKVMADAISTSYGRVSIIIVTYKNVDLTQLCLEKLLKNTTYPNYEIIVVDNDSRDGTANYLQYMEERHDNIKIIINDSNRGFAAANNQGLAIATGDYLVLLNNDTVPPRGWLASLLKHLQDKQIGLVGPVTNFVGNEAKIDVTYSTLDEMQYFATQYMERHQDKIFDINVLAMFCIAMRRDVYKLVGNLDESFGIGMFEDDDYSNRVKQLGYRVVCVEDSFVHHFGQAAFKKLIESGEYQKLWDKNQTYYEKKWGSWKAHQPRNKTSLS